MRVLRSVALALVVVVGCGDDAAETTVDEVEARPEPPHREVPEELYGPDGELLESDVVIAGLTLPRGLEPSLEEERRHVFRTEVPLVKVQRYFGTRLVTGDVERMGSGAVFRNAVPSAVRGPPVRMDVSILPRSRREVRVEIRERPSFTQVRRGEDEVRRQLERDRRTLD